MNITFNKLGYIIAITAMAIMPACTSDGDNAEDPNKGDIVVDYGDSNPDVQRLTLDIDLATATTINQDVYGANNSLITAGYDESNPSFSACYKELSAPATRYPGGTVANFYRYDTGTYTGYDGISDATLLKRVTNTNASVMKNKPNGHSDVPMYNMLQETGGSLSLVLNLFGSFEVENEDGTTSIEQQDEEETTAYLEKIKALGVSPKYIEMGNELYFAEYSTPVADINAYIELVKKYSAVVKAIFPDAKIGVVIPSHAYTSQSYLDSGDTSDDFGDRQEAWLNGLKDNLDVFDAVIIHLYAETGMTGSTTVANFKTYMESYKNCLTHSDKMFNPVLDQTALDFPGKTIWVTEYHVGGFSGDVAAYYRLRYSYIGGLFCSTNLLKLFKTPEVELGSWHSMIQWLSYMRTANGELLADNYNFGRMVNLNFFKMFMEPVRESTKFANVSVSGINQYEGTLSKYAGTYDDVESGLFYDEAEGEYYLLVINKLDTKYAFDIKSFIKDELGLAAGNVIKSQYIAPKSDGDYTIEEALELERAEDCDMRSVILYNDGVVEFAPYSVSVIKIK